jgi:hypothetical protein
MPIVTVCIVASGEDGFGLDQPKIHFIGEKNDIKDTSLKITTHQ